MLVAGCFDDSAVGGELEVRLSGFVAFVLENWRESGGFRLAFDLE